MADVFKSFDIQKTLNPLIWENGESDNFDDIRLILDARLKMISIAKMFMSTIKIPNIKIKDIILTGSLANYNWSEYSDVDLHVIIDKSQIDVDSEILDDYLKIRKDVFNSKHNITIKGFDVELYAQDMNETLAALGIYSIIKDAWIKTPDKENITIDKARIKIKVRDFIETMNDIENQIQDEEDPQQTLELIDALRDKIKKYRKSGLAKHGEYSDENLVFKYLRRTNYLQKLSDYKLETVDRIYSLQEID